MDPYELIISAVKLVFLLSPLVFFVWVCCTGVDKEVEDRKRNKKYDFEMEGHAD